MRRVVLCGLLLVLAACGPKGAAPRETRADAAIRGGILLRGNGAEPESLDPHLATSVSAGNILINLFEGLTRLDPATLEPQPGMAEAWSVSDDGLVYTFHLRDAQWSDGSPVRSQDFVFAFRRLLTPGLAASYAFMLHPVRHAREVNRGLRPPEKLGIEAPDDRTVRITLEHPTPYFLSLLAHWVAFPLPEHVVTAFGSVENRASGWTRPENIVVNGAFTLAEWQPESHVRLARNRRYWDDASTRLNGAEFFPIGNAEAEERAFRGGQLHVTYTLPRHRIHAWRSEADGRLRVDPYLESVGYVVNVERPGVSDPRVRRALSLALDRRLLVDGVLHGVRPAAFSVVPPGTAGYEPALQLTEDLEEARALLAQAGFPGGQGLPELRMIFMSGQDSVRVSEVVQQLWRERLGVSVTLENLERQTYFQSRREGRFDLCFFGWVGDYIDPETFLGLWRSDAGNNFARWRSMAYDEALARSTQGGPGRMEALQQAESLLLDALPVIPLYFGATQYLIDARVQGWHSNLLDQHPLRAVFFE